MLGHIIHAVGYATKASAKAGEMNKIIITIKKVKLNVPDMQLCVCVCVGKILCERKWKKIHL